MFGGGAYNHKFVFLVCGSGIVCEIQYIMYTVLYNSFIILLVYLNLFVTYTVILQYCNSFLFFFALNILHKLHTAAFYSH